MSIEQTMNGFLVRPIRTSEDIDFIFEFRKELNRNDHIVHIIGNHMVQLMLKIDSDGVLVAEKKETGELVGMLAGINHTPEFAFVGNYGVKKRYRGQGIGKAMWAKMMQHIGTERNISLDSEPEMLSLYRDKLGFSHVCPFTIAIYAGIPSESAIESNLIKAIDEIRIANVNATNINQVIDYDLKICHAIRDVNFLKECMKISKEEVLFLCAIDGNNQIKGYSLLMISYFNTILFQPLYADSKEIAQLLLYHSLSDKESILSKIARKNGIWTQIIKDNESGSNEAKVLIDKLGGTIKCLENSPILFNKKIISGEREKMYLTCSTVIYPF